jgi:hypothetical protein
MSSADIVTLKERLLVGLEIAQEERRRNKVASCEVQDLQFTTPLEI